MSAFYNTTHLAGDQLRYAVRQAGNQEDAILAIYRNARRPLAPSDVWAQCEQAGKRWPLTSVRRAITNLTDSGVLIRLEHQKRGIYGRPEYTWSAAA